MKRTATGLTAALMALVLASHAEDIFVAPEGRGGMTGADWSNALNGSRNGFHIDVKSAITTAVAGGATEVNVYFAGGTYAITNQLGLSSIAIPVKLSGGYLAETDGSLAKGETATTFSRTANNIRFVSASSMCALLFGTCQLHHCRREDLRRGGAWNGRTVGHELHRLREQRVGRCECGVN